MREIAKSNFGEKCKKIRSSLNEVFCPRGLLKSPNISRARWMRLEEGYDQGCTVLVVDDLDGKSSSKSNNKQSKFLVAHQGCVMLLLKLSN